MSRITSGPRVARPADGPDLVLNPASPISLTLAADEVRAFGQGPA